ncbi:hypothetical protein NTGHW29_120002 [Candidatus Nitrotoga sp. HW29]|nr:hypothetical protein NTGHW29_120002 [Candidatus Nitrotoga sp. HW29]
MVNIACLNSKSSMSDLIDPVLYHVTDSTPIKVVVTVTDYYKKHQYLVANLKMTNGVICNIPIGSSSEQVTNLDKNKAPDFRVRLMCTHVWTSNPSTGRIMPVLILKCTLQYENLFTPKVLVFAEEGSWRPTH